MSKRKREKMKTKEKRHEQSKTDQSLKASRASAADQTLKTARSSELNTPKPVDELFPHLKDAAPEWQLLYKAIRKASL